MKKLIFSLVLSYSLNMIVLITTPSSRYSCKHGKNKNTYSFQQPRSNEKKSNICSWQFSSAAMLGVWWISNGWCVLTFCGCGDGLSVGHGQRDGSHRAVVWGGSQNWGEVAWDLSYHLTTAVRLQVGRKHNQLQCDISKK